MVVMEKFVAALHRGRKLGRRFHPCAVAFLSSGQKLPKTDFQCTVPIFRQAIVHGDHTALYDIHGQYTYHGLLLSSCKFAEDISHYLEGRRQERVAILCPRDASYLIAQWACWINGQIAVPLPDDVSLPLLQHCVTDSQAELVIATRQHAKTAAKLCLTARSKLLIMDDVLLKRARGGHSAATLHTIGLDAEYYDTEDALITYTAGTTGMPQGAVFSHQAIQAQVSALVRAWNLSESDGVLHISPLHHISGIVNALACPLTVGASCVMLPKFDATAVWSQLLYNKQINILMAAPSIYISLIEEYEKSLHNQKKKIKAALSDKIRLMVCGCDPLAVAVSQRWQEISGHAVLQSYGTSETGTVIANTLTRPSQPGSVGTPLPGVEVQVVGSDGERLLYGNSEGTTVLSGDSCQGDLQVRGPSLFTKYWNQPEATSKTGDGWFNTGVEALYQNSLYQIVGVTSTDNSETGGTK